jgi:hypothetical protein
MDRSQSLKYTRLVVEDEDCVKLELLPHVQYGARRPSQVLFR